MFNWFKEMDDEFKLMIIGVPLIFGLSIFAIGIALIILYSIVKFFEL